MWAKKEDLILRLGEKKVHELSSRYIFDEDCDSFIKDEREDSRDRVINTFLEDARQWLLWELSRCYDNSAKEIQETIETGEEFRVILLHHIKLTVAMMKNGGDCEDCEKCKLDFTKLCESSRICSESGVCFERKSRFSVTENKSCMPKQVCCCDEEVCCCDKY